MRRVPRFSLRANRWAEISERLRRIPNYAKHSSKLQCRFGLEVFSSEHLTHGDEDLSRAGVGIATVRAQHVVQHQDVSFLPWKTHCRFLIDLAQLVYYRVFYH